MSATGFSQVPAHTGFFRVVDSSADAFLASANAGDSIRTVDISNSSSSFSTGTLFRDMGKYVTIVDANGMAVSKYALVQRVNGTEGSSEGNFYVRIFSSTSSGVNVCRTG